MKNDGRTAFVRVFGKTVHEPSVAIRRKSDVQVHNRANKQSGSEMGHGIWVGKAPMTDEHIILTENGVQKARSLHRVDIDVCT